MNEPVDRRDRNHMIGEDTIPGTEGLVGRNGKAPVFITPSNEFEQHGAFDPSPVVSCRSSRRRTSVTLDSPAVIGARIDGQNISGHKIFISFTPSILCYASGLRQEPACSVVLRQPLCHRLDGQAQITQQSGHP